MSARPENSRGPPERALCFSIPEWCSLLLGRRRCSPRSCVLGRGWRRGARWIRCPGRRRTTAGSGLWSRTTRRGFRSRSCRRRFRSRAGVWRGFRSRGIGSGRRSWRRSCSFRSWRCGSRSRRCGGRSLRLRRWGGLRFLRIRRCCGLGHQANGREQQPGNQRCFEFHSSITPPGCDFRVSDSDSRSISAFGESSRPPSSAKAFG